MTFLTSTGSKEMYLFRPTWIYMWIIFQIHLCLVLNVRLKYTMLIMNCFFSLLFLLALCSGHADNIKDSWSNDHAVWSKHTRREKRPRFSEETDPANYQGRWVSLWPALKLIYSCHCIATEKRCGTTNDWSKKSWLVVFLIAIFSDYDWQSWCENKNAAFPHVL